MSHDLLKSINKIKISVNENDQVLWECNAAEKCYNEASEKLKEQCDRLKHEIGSMDKEVREIESQIKTLTANYEVQNENMSLNQQSLINQRLYKTYLKEKIKKYEEETQGVVDEYTDYIEKAKEKLELTNSTYKILQAKRTELRQNRIRCMNLLQKIIELKSANRRKMQIKQKLFYIDMVEFAQRWINKRKHLKIMSRLEEDAKTEKEYLYKLTGVTEKLKQGQMNKFLQRQSINNSNIPKIEFPVNDSYNNKMGRITEKAKIKENNGFPSIKKMLEKNDLNVVDNLKKNELHKLKFNKNNSKVRILDNTTLTVAQVAGKLCNSKSKEERRNEIEAKIQKVVQNLNKSISRHNSKKTVTLPQRSQNNKKIDKPKVKEDCHNVSVIKNSQKNVHEKCEINKSPPKLIAPNQIIKKPETDLVKQGFNLPFSNTQHNLNPENGITVTKTHQKLSAETDRNKKASQDPTEILPNISKPVMEPVENAKEEKQSQFSINSSSKMQICHPGEKLPFNMFGSVDNSNYPTFFVQPDKTISKNNIVSQYNNTSLEMLSMPYTFNHQMNATDDYEEESKSSYNPNFNSPLMEENNVNMGINFSGLPNLTGQPIFSFGNFLK